MAWLTAKAISLCLEELALAGIPRSGLSGCPDIMNSERQGGKTAILDWDHRTSLTTQTVSLKTYD